MTILLVVLAALAVTGWGAFWCSQDQAYGLRVERDRFRARARKAESELSWHKWEVSR